MSTYNLKGFVSNPKLVDNTANAIAPVGELSSISTTYEPDVAQYSNTASYPNVLLSVFKCLKDGAATQVEARTGDLILQISDWMYTHAQLGQFSSNQPAFLTGFIDQFGEQITGALSGDMVQQNLFWFPSWLSFNQVNSTGDVITVRLWFSDSYFQTQYDEYTLRVIPPIDDLDQFFGGLTGARTALAGFTFPGLGDKIEQIKNDQPYSLLRFYTYKYVDSQGSGVTIDTTWTVIEYGVAGDNLDAIKAAMVQYIMAHTTHSQDDWSQIFPEIFLVTEFIVTPRWDSFAIANQSTKAGIHSPNQIYRDALPLALATAKGVGYTNDGVTQSLNILPVQYKSMTMLVVAGPLNPTGKTSIAKLFPDYINVPSDSLDFKRMSADTQNWVNFIGTMLTACEVMTQFSAIPVGFQRVIRNGLIYLMGSFGTIQYLMLIPDSLETIMPTGLIGSGSGA